MVRVALLNSAPSAVIQDHDRPRYPCLGLAYLSATLKANGFEVMTIDAKFDGMSQSEVHNLVTDFKPHILGFTAMTHEIVQAVNSANKLRDALPTSLMLIGGPHATGAPVRTLQEFPSFDIAVISEGEQTLLEIAREADLAIGRWCQVTKDNHTKILDSRLRLIKGIAWRSGTSILTNEPRQLISNLDSLPFPNFDHVRRKIETYPIYSSRGCPNNCVFCCRVLGNKIRVRSPGNVVAEIKQAIANHKPRLINFADETFTLPKERANAICEIIIQEGLNKEIKWTAQSRVTGVDYALFRKMKEAGCVQVDFGIESGNPDILRRIKKGITTVDAINTVKAAKKAGLKTGSYFIIGHPFETRETIRETIKFATKLNTSSVSFGIMVPYPGTEVYKMALRKEGGYKIISEQWQDYDKQLGNALEIEGLSRRELEKSQHKAYTTFYLRNFRLVNIVKLAISQRKLLWKMITK